MIPDPCSGTLVVYLPLFLQNKTFPKMSFKKPKIFTFCKVELIQYTYNLIDALECGLENFIIQ